MKMGKHDEFLKIEKGVYRDLYEHQVGLYAEMVVPLHLTYAMAQVKCKK